MSWRCAWHSTRGRTPGVTTCLLVSMSPRLASTTNPVAENEELASPSNGRQAVALRYTYQPGEILTYMLNGLELSHVGFIYNALSLRGEL